MLPPGDLLLAFDVPALPSPALTDTIYRVGALSSFVLIYGDQLAEFSLRYTRLLRKSEVALKLISVGALFRFQSFCTKMTSKRPL